LNCANAKGLLSII